MFAGFTFLLLRNHSSKAKGQGPSQRKALCRGDCFVFLFMVISSKCLWYTYSSKPLTVCSLREIRGLQCKTRASRWWMAFPTFIYCKSVFQISANVESYSNRSSQRRRLKHLQTTPRNENPALFMTFQKKNISVFSPTLG